jgi:hypothetical protein
MKSLDQQIVRLNVWDRERYCCHIRGNQFCDGGSVSSAIVRAPVPRIPFLEDSLAALVIFLPSNPFVGSRCGSVRYNRMEL